MQGLGDLVAAVSWFALLALPTALIVLALSVRWHRDQPTGERYRSAMLDVTVALSLLGIGTVTLVPVADYETGIERGAQLLPLVSIIDVLTTAVDASVAVRIVLFNVLLFIPFGFLITLRTGRALRTVVVTLVVSVLIETLQALLPLGRTANVDDVILNTLGAALGAWVASATRRATGRPAVGVGGLFRSLRRSPNNPRYGHRSNDSKSAIRFPAGSSTRTCLPPLPVTISLRKMAPASRSRFTIASRSSTSS